MLPRSGSAGTVGMVLILFFGCMYNIFIYLFIYLFIMLLLDLLI